MTVSMVGFDLEATGLDTETARIVSAALVELDAAGAELRRTEWLVDPGVEIPAESAAIHGISSAMARNHGVAANTAITEIAGAVETVSARDLPLVVFKAPFDLTLLDRELRRHTRAATGLHVGPVLDPLIIDRAMSDRIAPRTLSACCAHYGVRLDGPAHQAGTDALAAGRLMMELTGRYPELAAMPLDELQRSQATWYRVWAGSRRASLLARNREDEARAMRSEWPLRPYVPTASAAVPA